MSPKQNKVFLFIIFSFAKDMINRELGVTETKFQIAVMFDEVVGEFVGLDYTPTNSSNILPSRSTSS